MFVHRWVRGVVIHEAKVTGKLLVQNTHIISTVLPVQITGYRQIPFVIHVWHHVAYSPPIAWRNMPFLWLRRLLLWFRLLLSCQIHVSERGKMLFFLGTKRLRL